MNELAAEGFYTAMIARAVLRGNLAAARHYAAEFAVVRDGWLTDAERGARWA